jgi:hypothetical protein
MLSFPVHGTVVRSSTYYVKIKSYPITGLNRPTGFQEFKAPRFLDIGT